MPSEMFERGRRDAAADALDESFYQYYYDYKRGYDEVLRNRVRSRRRALLGRIARTLLWVVPLLVLLAGGVVAYRQTRPGAEPLLSALRSTPTATATRTPRPTLPPPSPTPTDTVVPANVLRADSFAVVTGTGKLPLLAHVAPGTKTQITARLGPGKQVRVLEGPQQADGLDWWRVEMETGGGGWAAGSYLAPIPNP